MWLFKTHKIQKQKNSNSTKKGKNFQSFNFIRDDFQEEIFSKKRKQMFYLWKGGHFAKNYINKRNDKILHQILSTTQVDFDEGDLESLFSEEKD